MPKSGAYEPVAGLSVRASLRAFVDHEVLPATGIDPAAFWHDLASIISDLAPRHRELLAVRCELQEKIDCYHRAQRGKAHDPAQYEAFLREIGYLVAEPAADAYQVATKNVDAELAIVAGPQIVAPLSNTRYVLNAANARWGSLYDALYGTDATPVDPEDPDTAFSGFDPVRAEKVISRVREFLDQAAPLTDGSHSDAASYAVEYGRLQVTLTSGSKTGLSNLSQLAGFNGPRHAPRNILLANRGLHIEIVVDGTTPVGQLDKAGVADVLLESALSAIMDLEDAVATVDADDKIMAYRNWLRLMNGTLSAQVEEDGRRFERRLQGDRSYMTPNGGNLILHGRALLLVRNVGHHMFTDAVLDPNGNAVPEAILDAAITVASALPDIRRENAIPNSRTGSVYVVKPKMHGPDEVGLSDALFKRIEELLGLPKYTMKIGVMNEERRTSVNLAACLSKVRDRTFFINTGFLDRTGDEIHTSMEAGPMVRTAEMSAMAWISAYNRNNIDVGLARHLPGRAQIGKGMWTAPDRMAAMMAEKVQDLQAGANTAWVPTPIAATLHAMHYHGVDVAAVQGRLRDGKPASLAEHLSIPLASRGYDATEVAAELTQNLQSLLGYVVLWVNQGVGSSAVPDLDNIRLMKDRATLRLNAQHVANWLHHNLITEEQVRDTMRIVAKIVDRQNAGTDGYRPMGPTFDGPAYRAAEDLVFKGRHQPNGYTEEILTARRREAKALAS